MISVLINGKHVDCVTSTDRGLLYGDGVFETVAVIDGSLRHWSRHLTRLQAGCDRLGMQAVDSAVLEDECQSLAAQADRAVLKVIITRGSGGRGYRVPEKPVVTRIVQLHDWPVFSPACAEYGVAARVCRTRLGHNPALAGIKHLNRLEQVLARQEWDNANIREGLLQDTGGGLIEGTMSNVFLVRDEALLTPDLQQCGVAGIMRTRVLELSGQMGIDTRIQAVGIKDLQEADEIFICNSLIGVWPVIAVDTCEYEKGAMTTRIQALLDSSPDSGNGWRT